jgi:molybdate transport system substrate-binding protein
MVRIKILLSAMALLAALVIPSGCSTARGVSGAHVTLNVSAAASLTDALTGVNAAYVAAHPGVTIVPNFASSGTCQQQIEQGVPCDVFLSAARLQMDNLENRGLLLAGSRIDLLNNRLVLIVPSASTLGITGFVDLASAAVKRIAIGDPASVPAGSYARDTLESLGLYDTLQSKLVMAANVRQALAYVETGDADAGMVFSTDALVSSRVKVVASAPDKINSLIAYPVAITKSSKNADAALEYIDFLRSASAMAIFEEYGFSPSE